MKNHILLIIKDTSINEDYKQHVNYFFSPPPSDYSLSLELGSGLLIGVPIPSSVATQGQQIEDAIQSALQQARYEAQNEPI